MRRRLRPGTSSVCTSTGHAAPATRHADGQRGAMRRAARAPVAVRPRAQPLGGGRWRHDAG
ncbi:MAG TPA: hypothetical protein VF897_06935 [Roseiflexaceae bacterium]